LFFRRKYEKKLIVVFVVFVLLLICFNKSVELENGNYSFSNKISRQLIKTLNKAKKERVHYFDDQTLYGTNIVFVFKNGLISKKINVLYHGIVEIDGYAYRIDPYDDFWFNYYDALDSIGITFPNGTSTSLRKIDYSMFYSTISHHDKEDEFEYDTYLVGGSVILTDVFKELGIDKEESKNITRIYKENIDNLNGYELMYEGLGIKRMKTTSGYCYYVVKLDK